MSALNDQLSWEQFQIQSSKAKKPIKKISEFNRLIAHSENFFLISGYGAFTDGYILIITKEFIPSYGLVPNNRLNEINFLIKLIKRFVKNKYNRKTVVFEHGMCACIGGLDRAHLHLMSVPENVISEDFKDSINKVLYNRKAGIKYIEYNNYKLENFHDINQIYEDGKNNKDIKIVGEIFNLKDIQNLSPEKWPLVTLDHINKGGHYVFFDSGEKNSSFITTNNFQTQFGREVVFEIEKKLNVNFKKEIKEIENKNSTTELWRWQNCMFEEKILSTIHAAQKEFASFEDFFQKEFEEFNLKVI
jgi:diadenosine tetraphosphate (Ap4A) HIT family hydrolase